MDYQRYLQLLQNQAQNSAQGGGFNVNSPISRGQTESLNNFISPEPTFPQRLGDMIHNIGIASLRGSPEPIAQEYGKTMVTPEERRAASSQSRMKSLDMLQKAEDVRQERLLQQQRMAQMESQHGEHLGETKRHNSMMGNYYNILGKKAQYDMENPKISKEQYAENKLAMEYKKLAEKGKMDAVPLDAYPESQATFLLKEAKEVANRAPTYGKLVNDISAMKELVEKNPIISDNANILFDPDSKGALPYIRRKFLLSKDEVKALDSFSKYKNDLIAHDLKSIPGVRPTDLFKKIVAKSKPSEGMSKGAMIDIFDDSLEDAEKYSSYAKAQSEAVKGRYHESGEKYLHTPPEKTFSYWKKNSPDGIIRFKDSRGNLVPIPIGNLTESKFKKLIRMGADVVSEGTE